MSSPRPLRRAWLLGSPVAHSVSPAVHNAAYREMGLRAVYGAAEVTPGRLGEVLRELVTADFLGANLTQPLKEAACRWMDRLETPADVLGAVNTVRLEKGRLVGSNTDAPGWLRSWDEAVGRPLAGCAVVLLGAGGAARALLWAVASRGARSVRVLNRTPERAQAVVGQIGPRFPAVSMRAGGLTPDAFARALEPGCVVVNCTSVGMAPGVEESPVEWPRRLPENLVACDLIYHPSVTRFLETARRRGACVLGGVGMLVHQAAAAIELWTGCTPPLEVMREAARKALRGC